MKPSFESFWGQNVLFTFAHMDHEILVTELIRRIQDTSGHCFFTYVSNGDSAISPLLRDVAPDIRKDESKDALHLLGVDRESLSFVNQSELGITRSFPGNPEAVADAARNVILEIRKRIDETAPTIIVVDAFEGSNPSHDLLNYIVYRLCIGTIPIIEFPHYTFTGKKYTERRVGSFTNNSGTTRAVEDAMIGITSGRLNLSQTAAQLKYAVAQCHDTQWEHLVKEFSSSYRIDQEMTREQYREVLERDHTQRPRNLSDGLPTKVLFYEKHRPPNQKYAHQMTFPAFVRAINTCEEKRIFEK